MNERRSMDGSDRSVDRLIVTPNHSLGITVSKVGKSAQLSCTQTMTGVQPTNQDGEIEVSYLLIEKKHDMMVSLIHRPVNLSAI